VTDTREGVGPGPYPFLPPWSLVVALATATGLLGFWSLGDKGFWLDEALSVARARLDLASLWAEVSGSQANMGLYYLVLHFWIAIGTTEAAVRSLSVVFAVLTIPVVYGLASRLSGVRAGVLASAFLAFNAFFLRYAQEARGYSLAVLLVCLSSYWLVRSLQQPLTRHWIAYVVTSVLAVYAHLFGALVLVAHLVSLAFRARGTTPWRPLCVSAAVISVGVAPLAAFVLFRDAGQIDWVPAPRAVDVYYFFRALAGDGGAILLAGYTTACALAIWRLTRGSSREERWAVALLAIWLVLPVAVAFGVSAAKPIFQNRYLIVALPAFAALAGVGLARMRPWRWQVAAAALLLLSASAIRSMQVEPERQYWRSTASFVLSRAKPGDAIAFYVYYGRVPFEYYVNRLGLAKPGVEMVELSSAAWIAGNRQPDPSPAVLEGLARRHARVWLVRLQDATPPGHPLNRFEQRRQIVDALSQDFSMTRSDVFPGGIEVELYEPRPAASVTSARLDTSPSVSAPHAHTSTAAQSGGR
jgi:mannosyltransferase